MTHDPDFGAREGAAAPARDPEIQRRTQFWHRSGGGWTVLMMAEFIEDLLATLAARDAALQALQEECVKLRAYVEGTEAALEALEAEWADRLARLRATLAPQEKP